MKPRSVSKVQKWEWQRVSYVKTGTSDVFETRPVIKHRGRVQDRGASRYKHPSRCDRDPRYIKVSTRDVMGWIPRQPTN